MAERMRHLALVMDGDETTDPEELAKLTTELRSRLLELEVESAELDRRSEVMSKAKPVDAVTIGALTITLSPVALRAVIHLVEVWLQNRPVRSVKLTIDDDALELTRISRADQRQLVQTFMERHGES